MKTFQQFTEENWDVPETHPSFSSLFDKKPEFWDDLIAMVSQNSEEMASLLGVSRQCIANWPKRIRQARDVAVEPNERRTRIFTGNK